MFDNILGHDYLSVEKLAEATLDIEPYLRREIGHLKLPGLAVVAHQNGREIVATGYGHHDTDGKMPIRPDTMFGVASLTKLVTASIVLRLAEQGRLAIDDPVALHFPAFELAHRTPMRLRHLLSHASGLPGLASRFHTINLANPQDATGGTRGSGRQSRQGSALAAPSLRDADELIAYLNTQRIDLLAAPGTLLNYSNEGFCLLGGLIERLSGSSYASAVQREVFAPLAMKRSTIGNPTPAQFEDVARPLIRANGSFAAGEFWDAPLFYAAGGMIASARDLIRLISLLDESHALLSPASRQQLMHPGMAVASRPNAQIAYGFGLEYQHVAPDATMLWHSGQRAGISSFVGWVAQHNLALTVLSNVADVPVARIGHTLASMLLERTDIVWPPRSGNCFMHDKHPDAMDRFTGRFANAEGFDCRVLLSDKQLCLDRGNGTAPDVFQFTDESSGSVADQTFRFLSRTVGTAPTAPEVWALALDLRVLKRQTA